MARFEYSQELPSRYTRSEDVGMRRRGRCVSYQVKRRLVRVGPQPSGRETAAIPAGYSPAASSP